MGQRSTGEIQKLVGYPTYTLLDNGTNLSPFDVWDPPSGKIKFSAHDLHQLFHKECIAFVGDSLQRRAADTLHILIENKDEEKTSKTVYYYKWDPKSASRSRRIGEGSLLSKTSASKNKYSEQKPVEPGTIDSLWYPTHVSLKKFKYQKNHTLIMAGIGAWENEYRSFNPKEWEQKVNSTIHHLYNTVPKSVPIFWKTSSWGWYWNWKELKRTQKMGNPKDGNNYLVYLANQVAKDVIESINASNLILLDWSKEILPYSFDERITTNMMAEDHNISAWHVGPKGRGLLLQMLASEFVDFKYGGNYKQVLVKQELQYKAAPRLQTQNMYMHIITGLCLALTIVISLFQKKFRPSLDRRGEATSTTC